MSDDITPADAERLADISAAIREYLTAEAVPRASFHATVLTSRIVAGAFQQVVIERDAWIEVARQVETRRVVDERRLGEAESELRDLRAAMRSE